MPSRRSFLKRGLVTAATASLLPRVASAAEHKAAPAATSGELTLFAFDDHSIPQQQNLKLTLVQVDKHPDNPVLRRGPEGSPDYGHAILYGSVLHIEGKFRMWYLGMIQKKIEHGQAPGWFRPMCYAESEDGIHWTKPELGLVDLNGNKKNNICLIESDAPGFSRINDYLTVIHDPEDPDPKRRYKVAFVVHLTPEEMRGGVSKVGPEEKRWCAFITATSADGLRWKVIGDRPANAGGERFEVSGLYRFKGTYYATGQCISPWTWLPDGRNCGRVMLGYQSPDFIHWSPERTFCFARAGQLLPQPIKGQQTHMGAGIWNRGNVLVGLYGQWQDSPTEPPKGSPNLWGTRIDLGLVVSNDGLHFREPITDFKVIPRGGEGAWDTLWLLQGHAFANVGDKTYIWYSHGDPEDQFRSPEIGLATLRRDGFGYLSLHTTAAHGHCVTAHLIPPHGSRLYLNVDNVSADAPLLVELLDERHQPISDYSGDHAARVTTSGTRQAVTWPKALPASFVAKISFPENGESRLYALYLDAAA